MGVEEETLELGIFARMSMIGRTIIFMLLKENGWLSKEDSKPTKEAIEQGLLTTTIKYCQSPKYSTTKFMSTHITEKGRLTFFKQLPALVANVDNEDTRNRIAIRICKAGFSDLLRKDT